MNRRRDQREFDVAPGDFIAAQSEVRPEPPVRSVGELAELLEHFERTVGRSERLGRPITGDRFLL